MLFSWLSSEAGDGDSAVAVLQMRSGGKEEGGQFEMHGTWALFSQTACIYI